MIGDIINIKDEYFVTVDGILKAIKQIFSSTAKMPEVIAIGGESGSGKSVTAVCLQSRLKEMGYKPFILHQDDYFILPPATNHQKRMEDISWVGYHEVNLALIQSHIFTFKSSKGLIAKPLVDYNRNLILEESIDLNEFDCLIVEGTYVNRLLDIDCNVFIEREYFSTLNQRIARGREAVSWFIEKVLSIEHELIKVHKEFADIIIDQDYMVTINKLKHDQ